MNFITGIFLTIWPDLEIVKSLDGRDDHLSLVQGSKTLSFAKGI